MRFTLPFVVLAVVAVGNAWELEASYDDNTKVTLKGHHNSHCKKFEKHNARIDNVYFKESLSADTFKLYTDDRCKRLSVKDGKGSHPVPRRFYGSYEVY